MNGFTFQAPAMLLSIFLVPALFWLFRHARARRQTLLESFGGQHSPELVRAVLERHRRETRVLVAVALLGVALARPGANPHPRVDPKGGRDTVFLLDVSRSMLANDLHPSRLERAKLDIVNRLAVTGNDRVGLVVFAGVGVIRSPLTTDYDFVRTMLEGVTPDSVARGSTYLQSALEKTTNQMLSKDRRGLQDVILLTDGGDQGSHPEKTLEKFNALGARLLVVGYGDPQIGARIPSEDADNTASGFIMDGGQEVWAKLREDPLRALAAAASEGEYVRRNKADFDLGRIYRQWSAKAPVRPVEDRLSMEYDEYFAWLVGPALLLLLLPFPRLGRRAAGAMATLAVAGLLTLGQIRAENAAPLPPFTAGVKFMKDGLFEEAVKSFNEAATQADGPTRTAASLFDAALARAELAAREADPDVQVVALNEAIDRMRRALLVRTDWRAAREGLEVLYFRQAAAEKAHEEKQNRLAEIDKKVAEVVKELKRLLGVQKDLITETLGVQQDQAIAEAQKVERLKTLGSTQATTGKETESARARLNAIHLQVRAILSTFSSEDDEDDPAAIPITGLEGPLAHLATGRQAQDDAAGRLGPMQQWQSAWLAEGKAAAEIDAALKALSANQQNDDPTKPEDGENSDEPPADNSTDSTEEAKQNVVSDPLTRELPKPNFDATQILQEEKDNAALRAKDSPARVSQGEKDW